jgi:transposase
VARKYDHEYKVQAVKLAKEIGGAKAENTENP